MLFSSYLIFENAGNTIVISHDYSVKCTCVYVTYNPLCIIAR